MRRSPASVEGLMASPVLMALGAKMAVLEPHKRGIGSKAVALDGIELSLLIVHQSCR